jgi:Ca2+-binding EF-hand superfamily protein
VAEGLVKVKEFEGILILDKENQTKEDVNKLLSATDNDGRTVFHVAAEFSEVELFQRILNFAKGNLTKEEINKFLLDTDNDGKTVFHVHQGEGM